MVTDSVRLGCWLKESAREQTELLRATLPLVQLSEDLDELKDAE